MFRQVPRHGPEVDDPHTGAVDDTDVRERFGRFATRGDQRQGNGRSDGDGQRGNGLDVHQSGATPAAGTGLPSLSLHPAQPSACSPPPRRDIPSTVVEAAM